MEDSSQREPRPPTIRVARFRGNAGKALARAAGALVPANLLVLARNAGADARRRRAKSPWRDYAAGRGGTEAAARHGAGLALQWLSRSQDAVRSGGVGSYEFSGWTSGYPEVTGYIIPTFWDCRELFGESLGDRARRMADWELGLQRPVGGWEAGAEGDGLPPVVFNTAQVIRGLVRTHRETGDERYLDAAVRAADWIVSVQEPDGSWEKHNHLGLKRVYDTYVAAPLAELAVLLGRDDYSEAAVRNCEFALRNQRENGWFDLCDNSPHFNLAPSTHTLCYTIDGLLDTGRVLDRPDFVSAAARSADALAAQVDGTGYLPGRFDDRWQPRVSWSCLTGAAQLGVICGKLATPGDHRRPHTMARLADFLLWVQALNGVGHARRGAVAGSFPIWGPYAPLKYPCWAAKYLVDFLLALQDQARPPRSPMTSDAALDTR